MGFEHRTYKWWDAWTYLGFLNPWPFLSPCPGNCPLLPTCAPGSHCSGISLLQIQIGCHTDDLTRASKLFRGPLVINRCCLDKPTKSITCLWGGLLYIIVPQSSKLGTVPVTVKGAVHAPYYKLGEWTPWSEPRGRVVRRPSGAAWCRKRERFRLAEGREVCFLRFEAKEIKTKPHHIPGTFVEEG